MLAALRDSWFGAKLNGSAHGIHDANPDGERYGEPYGNPHEVPHGTTQGTPHVPTAEELLGLKFCRDERGVVRPLGPGQSPDLHPVEFMQVFLRWLMTQPPFPGNELNRASCRSCCVLSQRSSMGRLDYHGRRRRRYWKT